MAESTNQASGVDKWTNEEVVSFLKKNGLEAIALAFEENEVTGLDLLLLTEDELRSMLGISKLQASKVKSLVSSDAARPEADDPRVTNDFVAGTVPRISERPEDYSDDEEECSDLRRGCTGVGLAPPRAAAAPPTGLTVVGTVTPMPGPVLPIGTGALQLDASTVSRYQVAVATITRLEAERVAQDLPAARSRLAASQKRLKLQEAKFQELRKEEAKKNEKLDKLVDGKWYPGKFLLGSKRHEEKINKKTEKLTALSNQVRAAGAQLEELNAAVHQQTGLVSELTAKCAALDEARCFCAALLQSAFAGGAVGDARENLLETEVAALGPKIEEVRRYKSVYGKAYELMRGSREALDQAWQLLESASGLATMDIAGNFLSPVPFSQGPAGLMVDIMKRSQMRQGVELCKVAAELAIKSRAMVPDMPRVDAEKLRQLRAGFGLMDVVFDNMISDIIVARKIRGMLAALRSALTDVEYAEKWLHGWISGRIDADLRSMEATLAAKRSELHAHRMALMQAWIEARAAGAVREAPPQPQPGVPVMGAPAPGVPVHGMPAPVPVPAYGYVL